MEEFNQPTLPEEQKENQEEEKEVEVMEFSLDDEEINELIVKLVTLKQLREPFTFEVDDENELLISYEDDEGENSEGESEE